MGRRLVKVLLAGDVPRGLERLLADVLEDAGLTLELVPRAGDAELVFAVLGREPAVGTLVGLRQEGARRLLALLPMHDDRAARRALEAGADLCFALDTPLERLGVAISGLLAGPAPPRQAGDAFALGPRARRVLGELRAFARRQPTPIYRIAADAERRLEAAIRADGGGRRARPFRLGERARLEVARMRLDVLAVERLERAVEADLDGDLGRVA